jgi:hypothetical protein
MVARRGGLVHSMRSMKEHGVLLQTWSVTAFANAMDLRMVAGVVELAHHRSMYLLFPTEPRQGVTLLLSLS